MAIAIEDIVNQGLRDAGVPLRISDIYEGSEPAKVALEVFTQTRDEIQRLADWSFNRRQVNLSLLKGPPPTGGYNPMQPWSPVYPAPGYLFEYAYPSDCLDLRAIIQQPGLTPDLDPVPQLWLVQNDATPNVSGTPPVASGPPAKVILCNVNNAIGAYRAQVTDPNLWDSGYIAALVASFGDKFSTAFGAQVDAQREQKAEAQIARQVGSDVRG
jgi:hypothetical protein